jgi:histidyl-tRNA synthetase
MKKADRSGAVAALILGDEELASGQVVFKPLRSMDAQQVMDRETLGRHLAKSVAEHRG